MSFENLGYAASNELSPEMWKDYMLSNLAKQDAYQQARLSQYVQARERAKAKAKREKLVEGIKSGLQFGMQTAMTPAAETPLTDSVNANLTTQFEPTSFLDQFNTTPPWEK